MKRTLKFADALKICLGMAKKNLVRLMVTVALLAMCMSAVGTCLCTVVTDYGARQAQIFRHSALHPDTVGFARYDWRQEGYADGLSMFNTSSLIGSLNDGNVTTMSESDLKNVAEETGLAYAFVYRAVYAYINGREERKNAAIAFAGFPEEEWFFADYDRYDEAVRYNEAKQRGEEVDIYTYRTAYRKKYLRDEAGEKHYAAAYDQTEAYTDYVCLSEAARAELGLSLLAGRLPEGENEIAVNECVLNEFMRRGYYLYEDVEAGKIVEWVYNDPVLQSKIVNAEEIPKKDPARAVPIRSAEDLVGKKLLIGGRKQGAEERNILVTVSGVLYTGCGYEVFEMGHAAETAVGVHAHLRDKIFISPALVQALGISPVCMIAPRPKDTATVKKCLAIEQRALDEAKSLYGERRPDAPLLIADEKALALQMDEMNTVFPQIRLLFGVAGALFGGFGLALTFYLMAAAAEKDRKQIGILRTLGARKGDVYKIFFLLALFIGAAVFVLAVAGTVAVVYGTPIGAPVMGIRFAAFGVPQALCLLLLCMGAPVLAMWLPVRKFLKRTCVAMIGDREREVRRV